jgi:hypothetical protein
VGRSEERRNCEDEILRHIVQPRLIRFLALPVISLSVPCSFGGIRSGPRLGPRGSGARGAESVRSPSSSSGSSAPDTYTKATAASRASRAESGIPWGVTEEKALTWQSGLQLRVRPEEHSWNPPTSTDRSGGTVPGEAHGIFEPLEHSPKRCVRTRAQWRLSSSRGSGAMRGFARGRKKGTAKHRSGDGDRAA